MPTLAILRRSESSWPEPEQSVGRLICRLGKYCCWEATGSVREAFARLGPEIRSYLDRNTEPIPEYVSWKIYMVGSTANSATPTIIFCCENLKYRQTIRKQVKSSGLLDMFPGIKTTHMHHAPGFGPIAPLASDTLIEVHSTDVPAARDNVQLLLPTSKSPMGMLLYIRSNNGGSNSPWKCTIGGVVQSGAKFFYMTASHTFAKALETYAPSVDTDGSPDVDMDDSEDEEITTCDSEEDVGLTSRGSVTPDNRSSLCSELSLSLGSRSSSDLPGPHGSSGSPLSDVTIGAPPSFEDSPTGAADQGSSLPRSYKQLGGLRWSHLSGLPSGLDVALIEVTNLQHQCINTTRISSGPSKDVLSIHGLAGSEPTYSSVTAISGNSGAINGQLSETPSYMRAPGQQQYLQVYTVCFDSPLERGDSGSWVFDAKTGKLWGHIVAGSPQLGVAYIMPASLVFDALRQHLGTTVVLPTNAPVAQKVSKTPTGPSASGTAAQRPEPLSPIISLDQTAIKVLLARFRLLLLTRRLPTLSAVRENKQRVNEEGVQNGHPRTSHSLSIFPLALEPPQNARSQRFRNLLNTLARVPSKWENPGLLDEALGLVPVEHIYIEAEERANALRREAERLGAHKKPLWGYQDCVIQALMRWFKDTFFTWVTNPPCSLCGSPTIGVGSAGPIPDEQARGANTVEIYQCSDAGCSAFGRFPRYSDPFVLLQSRKGRVGEWTNCFGMLCRAMGSKVRWIWNSEDHTWLEIYSEHRRRWVHVDVCEQTWDQPAMYTLGWHRKLGYCIAFSNEGAADVTRRYVRSLDGWGERSRVPEPVLQFILQEITAARRAELPKEDRCRLSREDTREENELRRITAQWVAAAFVTLDPTIKPSSTVADKGGPKALEAATDRVAERQRMDNPGDEI